MFRESRKYKIIRNRVEHSDEEAWKLFLSEIELNKQNNFGKEVESISLAALSMLVLYNIDVTELPQYKDEHKKVV